MHDMREREAKLVVSRSFRIAPAGELAKDVASTVTDVIDQRAAYFDTDDFRLARSDVSLRYRSDDGWTVKLPVSRDSSGLVRNEHSFNGTAAAPPEAALSLVKPFTRLRPVRQVAEINTHRRRSMLFDDRGEKLAELDDDDVVGTTVTGTTTRFREVEVELGDSAPGRVLREVVNRLRKEGARPCSVSKISRVLGDAVRAPSDIPDARELSVDSTVADLATYSMVEPLRRLVARDAQVRAGEDPEAVHKARVATRRLRSDLRTLRPLLSTDWCESLRDELKWLGLMLGRVRDADVFLSALQSASQRLSADRQQEAAIFIGRLRDGRARDQAALVDALNSDRYTKLLDRLVLAVHHPAVRADVADKRARTFSRHLLARAPKRLRRQVRKLGPDPDDPALHEARKRAKQARYACELLAPLLGKRARKAAHRYEAIQELLGEHQDAVVAVAWLTDAGRDIDQCDAAFVAGQLAGLFVAERDRARAAWPSTWRRARNIRVP
jgi:CHAD domain-containing protein